MFGSRETIESSLAKWSWTVNTSLVERLNLDCRQHVAAIGRWVNTLCKYEAGLWQQLTLFQTYHNFVLPHAGLRLPLPQFDAIPEIGSIKRWQPRTPAMAAGLSDRVWSLREVLMGCVPAWPQFYVDNGLSDVEARNPSWGSASPNGHDELSETIQPRCETCLEGH